MEIFTHGGGCESRIRHTPQRITVRGLCRGIDRDADTPTEQRRSTLTALVWCFPARGRASNRSPPVSHRRGCSRRTSRCIISSPKLIGQTRRCSALFVSKCCPPSNGMARSVLDYRRHRISKKGDAFGRRGAAVLPRLPRGYRPRGSSSQI